MQMLTAHAFAGRKESQACPGGGGAAAGHAASVLDSALHGSSRSGQGACVLHQDAASRAQCLKSRLPRNSTQESMGSALQVFILDSPGHRADVCALCRLRCARMSPSASSATPSCAALRQTSPPTPPTSWVSSWLWMIANLACTTTTAVRFMPPEARTLPFQSCTPMSKGMSAIKPSCALLCFLSSCGLLQACPWWWRLR